jgi:PhoPQ-activated pathogenicity-related protein
MGGDQKQIYGEYSEEIQDYVNLEISQAIHSEFGRSVVQMIDPYSYRNKLTMPKLIIMGTNDPYWTVDAVKHYINEIPGHNLLHYVPNAGHGLGDKVQAFGVLGAFFTHMLYKLDYPVCEWNLVEKGFQAFYVDLVYKDPHGDEYTVSTRMYVSDNEKVFVQ